MIIEHNFKHICELMFTERTVNIIVFNCVLRTLFLERCSNGTLLVELQLVYLISNYIEI